MDGTISSETKLAELETSLRIKAAELTLKMLEGQRPLHESWDTDDDTYAQQAWRGRPRASLSFMPVRIEARLDDTKDGRYYPYYETESDLWRNLAAVRNLPTFDGGTVGILNALRAYVVSGEWTVNVTDDDRDDTQLARAAQYVVETFLDQNEWWDREHLELIDNARLDGERWIGLYPDPAAVAIVEQLAPEHCREPRNRRELNEMLSEPDSTWYFGVHCRTYTHANRPHWARPLGYHFVFDEAGNEWDYLPSWPQPGLLEDTRCAIHFKRNSPTKAARGVSDFYPIAADAEEGHKVGRNVTIGAAIQAAIAMIIQSESPTRAASVADVAGNAVDTIQRLRAGGGTSTAYVQKFNPGTVARMDKGTTYHPGPMGSSDARNYVDVAKFASGRCGRRWNMPEAFVTGDPSNAGMASLLVGASPFVKYCEYEQSRLKLTNQYILWRVLRMAYLMGRFGNGIAWNELERRLQLEVVAPQVAPDKPTEADSATKTTRLKTLFDSGIITGETWATMEGVPETDVKELQAQKAQQQAQIQQQMAARPTADVGSPVGESATVTESWRHYWLGYP